MTTLTLRRLIALTLFVGATIALYADTPSEKTPAPYLLWSRSLERTTFQQAGPLGETYDLRTDAAMPYGIGDHALDALAGYEEAGYVMHLMTGVAWGDYTDYLDGKFDGIDHWDQGQRDPQGDPVNHGHRVPYMVPSVAFGRFLEAGLQKAIDSGVIAVHLEEPEFWARAGFSESFKRAWHNFYNEPWVRPDETCDAQYRASKLKHHLYCRMLSQLCDALKETTLLKNQRQVRFFVPTHSLLNYSQWSIVSPESALLDLPGIDGLICQTWTGTARTPNTYNGSVAERTFETAFLEYGSMQELTRGSGKRMYLLHDPIEDNPDHDWDDYQRNYICTLVASLLAPDSHHYEVCPWPRRVFTGKYPAKSPDPQPIPAGYATTLMTVFSQLRDMDQPEIDWCGATDGVGVFLSDSAMFQRAEPATRDGATRDRNDSTRPNRREVQQFAGFYGLTLPLVKHGIAVRPTTLENILRYPGYLDRYKVLVLSYEFQKPYTPGLHAVLADWVRRGGVLVYVGADTDPFHQARDWWNDPRAIKKYASPTEHLLESLGLETNAATGRYECGQGQVFIERKHPAWFSRSNDGGVAYRKLIADAFAMKGETLCERNYFQLRRGPYLIAAVMNESLTNEPLQLKGRFVDLLDATLAVTTAVNVAPSEQVWLLDLGRVTALAPCALAASGRIEDWSADATSVSYRLECPTNIETSARLLLPSPPKLIEIDGQVASQENWSWDAASQTVLISHPGKPSGVNITVAW